jgi:hypothetical protein
MALNSLVAMTEPAFVSSKFKQTYFFAMRKFLHSEVFRFGINPFQIPFFSIAVKSVDRRLSMNTGSKKDKTAISFKL